MVRRKGEMSSAVQDIQFPHQIIIPADQCTGRQNNIVTDFCKGLSVASRHHSVNKQDRWHLVFCFREHADAAKFQERFGGDFFDPATRGRGKRWHLLREPRKKRYY